MHQYYIIFFSTETNDAMLEFSTAQMTVVKK